MDVPVGPDDPTQGGAPTPAAGTLPARLGPYELRDELGRGGMGVVCRAYRPDLKREFALKIILPAGAEDADAIRRFRREAQAAAQLADHPGIVGVHDVGEAAGRVYFAMDLVEGRSLEARARTETCTPQDAARWVAQAARAVHHAHERGILHRDLKPANVLITPDGRALVTDFGLAKHHDAGPEHSRLTKSGQVLGTPAYMPPEQAASDPLDARADVYSLGATLYESLTGTAPFEGDTVFNVLAKVMTDDPVPPCRRDPHVPRELEIITLRCLAKEPERRYPTAAALADDLERWLAGEAILARPPSLVYRLRRRLARRKAAVVVGVLALAVLGGSAAVVLPRWFRAEAAALARMRQVTDMALDAALRLRRAKDLAGMRAFAAQVETACREAADAMPQAPEPHYRLGRMYRALMRDDDAWAAQATALERDPHYAPARYERAVLTARRFQARLQELLAEEQRRAGREFAERQARHDTEETLTHGAATLVAADAVARALLRDLDADMAALADAGSALPEAQLHCVRGMRAAYAFDHAAAQRELVAALGGDPTMVEAHELLGDVLRNAMRRPEALEVYDRAIAVDAGYIPFYAARGRMRLLVAQIGATSPAEKRALQQGAREDLALVVAEAPTNSGALDLLMQSYMDRARLMEAGGEAPFALLEEARRVLEQALAAMPRAALPLVDLAELHQWTALFRLRAGQDPLPAFQAGLDAVDRAIALDASCAAAHRVRGTLHVQWADAERWRGKDPMPRLQEGLYDFDRALKLNPDDGHTWLRYADGWVLNVEILVARGRDPASAAEKALNALAEAGERLPGEFHVYLQTGEVHAALAHTAAVSGRDPSEEWDRALDAYGHAVAMAPSEAEPLRGRAKVLSAQGERAALSGRDGRPGYDAALRDLDAAVAREPQNVLLLGARGQCHTRLASLNAEKPATLLKHLNAALSDLDAGLALDPHSDTLLLQRANARQVQAVCAAQSGADAEPFFEGAAADVESALAVNPDLLEAHGIGGSLYYMWMQVRLATGNAEVESLATKAIDHDTAALHLNRAYVGARRGRADTRTALAVARARAGQPITDLLRAAVTDYREALAQDDTVASAWTGAAWTHMLLADDLQAQMQPSREEWAEAVRCYERAAALDPAVAAENAQRLAYCRQALAAAEQQK